MQVTHIHIFTSDIMCSIIKKQHTRMAPSSIIVINVK